MSHVNMTEEYSFVKKYYRLEDGNIIYPFHVGRAEWQSQPSVGVHVHMRDGSSYRHFISMDGMEHLLIHSKVEAEEDFIGSLSKYVEISHPELYEERRALLQRAFFGDAS